MSTILQILLERIANLEKLCSKKEKFLQVNPNPSGVKSFPLSVV